MDESALKNGIITRFRTHGALATRIESPDVSAGIPDIYMCYMSNSVFIEVKIGNSPQLKPSQYHWLLNHAKARGNSYILWYVDDHCRIIPTSNIGMLRARSKKDWMSATEFRCELSDFTPNRAVFYSRQIIADRERFYEQVAPIRESNPQTK